MKCDSLATTPKRREPILSERNLFQRLRRALKADLFSPAQLQELEQLKVGAPQPGDDRGKSLLNEVRQLGYYPKETKANPSESKLARRLRAAFNKEWFKQDQLEELQQLREQSVHPRMAARPAEFMQAAEEPPDPREGFADVAENSLEQDLLILASGQQTRALLKGLKRYRDFIAECAAAKTDFCLKHKDRILKAAETPPSRGNDQQASVYRMQRQIC